MISTIKDNDMLAHRVRSLFLFIMVLAGLYYAQVFIKPICFAMLLAMLLLPMTKWMESKGIHSYVGAFIGILIVVVVIGAVVGLLWWQIAGLAKDTVNIERTFDEWTGQAQRFLYHTFNLNYSEQKEMLDEQQSTLTAYIPKIMEGALSTLAKTILVLVYAYMLLIHRDRINRFLLRVGPGGDEEKTRAMMKHAKDLSIGYLGGLLKLIFAMSVLFSLGYWIVGVKNPIFFGSVCGAMEMIPFLGNFIGALITSVGSVAQDGNAEVIPLIILVYLVIQFIQSYILEPLILGSEVNVNPLFSILALILGELLWGVAGMILAIPILGIVKIYFDNTEKLKPYGQLIGADVERNSGIFKRIKGWFSKKTDS